MKFKSLMTTICVLAAANVVSAAPFAYVANSGTKNVTVIDTADNTIKATVPLPGTNAQRYPYSVAVGASGQFAYVGLQTANEIAVIDTYTNTVINRIGLGLDNPGGLAVNAAETRLYVASQLSNYLIIIDITGEPVEVDRVFVGNGPEGVVLSPAGDKAYVASSLDGTVTTIAIDEAHNSYTPTAVTTVGSAPIGLAISANGSKLYVADRGGYAKVINTATMAVTNLSVGGGVSVAVRTDGTKAYAPSNLLSKLYVIDGPTNIVSATQYDLAMSPFGSAVAPNDNLYVAMEYSDKVAVFNTADNTFAPPIDLPVGAKPTSMGNFIGPVLPYTITSTKNTAPAPLTGCNISPFGIIPVNSYGRSFTISPESNEICEVKVDGVSVGQPSGYKFSGIEASHTIDASQAPEGTYFTVSGDWLPNAGGACVESTPAGINCSSKSAKFIDGTTVTLKASTGFTVKVSPNSWGVDCAEQGTTCTLTNITSDKSFGSAVQFEVGGTGPIYNLTKTSYYQTCDEAVAAAATNDIIKISNLWTTGCTTTGSATIVTLSGNWLPDFSVQSSSTSLGTLTITNVGVIADNLTI